MNKVCNFLVEMATLTPLKAGYGFSFIMYANDHNPPYIHLYKSLEDIKSGNYYTRILVPEIEPQNEEDIKSYKGDVDLNSNEKKNILKWFKSPYKKIPSLTNYQLSVMQWDIFQNTDENDSLPEDKK